MSLQIDLIVKEMTANLGLSDFLTVRERTYNQLIIFEFMSLLNISEDSDFGALTIQARLLINSKHCPLTKFVMHLGCIPVPRATSP